MSGAKRKGKKKTKVSKYTVSAIPPFRPKSSKSGGGESGESPVSSGGRGEGGLVIPPHAGAGATSGAKAEKSSKVGKGGDSGGKGKTKKKSSARPQMLAMLMDAELELDSFQGALSATEPMSNDSESDEGSADYRKGKPPPIHHTLR